MTLESFKSIVKNYYEISETIHDLLSIGFDIMDNPKYPIQNLVYDMFDEIMFNVFENFRTDTEIFRNTKPTKVLNKIPYRIGKVGKYANIKFGK